MLHWNFSEPKNPRFIIESGFKSRAGYNGARTVYKSSIAKETSYLSFKLIRLDPGCGVAVLSSGDYYYYCTFCSLGPVHVLLADPRSKKFCKKYVKLYKGVSNLKVRLDFSYHHPRRCKHLLFLSLPKQLSNQNWEAKIHSL